MGGIMLVFLSDLHFEDASAGKHNINSKAFVGFTDDLKKLSKNAEEIHIILLGDIFDLNRTTSWFEKGITKPWSTDDLCDSKVGLSAERILDKIISINDKSLSIFREWVNKGINNKQVDITYLPGNHDRLCNCFPSLRKKIRETLLIPGEGEPFPHVYKNPEYRVFAFHGHEYDPANFGADYKKGFSFDDESIYQQIPIGDIITAEFGAQLVYIANEMKPTANVNGTPQEFDKFLEHLTSIDNVRPTSAVFDWIYYELGHQKVFTDFYKKVIDQVIDNLMELDYIQKWMLKHKTYKALHSIVDGVESVYNLFSTTHENFFGEILEIYFENLYGKIGKRVQQNDIICDQIAKELIPQWCDYDYFVAGHTHIPILKPIRVMQDGREKVYMNTGTWRKAVLKCQGPGYQIINQLTSICFYNQNENQSANSKQIYEIWNGILKEEEKA
jgi:UDP-2,3-diacylglucosamine pyrophosphatase LpxH